jgi:RNA polymerase sigma factor (sigma-70 family)
MVVVEQDIIPKSKTDTDASLAKLYEEAFPSVARTLHRMGAPFEDARDIFHDSLLAYVEQALSNGKPKNEIAYLVGIARHLFLKKQERRNRTTNVEIADDSDNISSLIDESTLSKLIAKGGERCLRILRSFYYENRSISEIAKLFGFGNAHSASVQKYKCIEKIRDELKNDKELYENIFE